MEPHQTMTDGENVTQASAETYRMWADELTEKVTDMDKVQQNVLLVSARLLAMRSINDARYLPANTTLEPEQFNKPRENNMQILLGRLPSSLQEFNSS